MTKRTVVPAVSALALIAGLGMAGSAQANWNGFYIGGNVGYGWGDAKQPAALPGGVGGPLTVANPDADQDGWIGGAQFGNQWMLGRFWVTGFEVEWNYSSVEGDDGGGGPFGDVNEVSGNWEAAALARLGVLITPRTQIYGIGGYGWYNADVTSSFFSESRQDTFTGWTWGFGFDRECMGGNMTWGVRYRSTSYDQERVVLPVSGYDLGVEPSIDAVTFRLGWRL